MKRKIFFWLEKLRITPAERKAVAIMAVVLSVFSILNVSISRPVYFGGDYYKALEKRFAERTALLKKQQNSERMRYFPEEKLTLISPPDTVDKITKSKSFKKDEVPGGKSIVNINTAAADELQRLPGIGPAYAKRILDYRNKNGLFTSVEDLKKIRGIAEKRLEKLKPFIKLRDS